MFEKYFVEIQSLCYSVSFSYTSRLVEGFRVPKSIFIYPFFVSRKCITIVWVTKEKLRGEKGRHKRSHRSDHGNL